MILWNKKFEMVFIRTITKDGKQEDYSVGQNQGIEIEITGLELEKKPTPTESTAHIGGCV